MATGNSHGGSAAGASALAVSSPVHHDDSMQNNKGGSKEDKLDKEEKEKSHSKEKSVLQAKLTKLAIQIGYAGMTLWPTVRESGRKSTNNFLFRFDHCHPYRDHPDHDVLHQEVRLRRAAMAERIFQPVRQILDYRCHRVGRGCSRRSPIGRHSISGLFRQGTLWFPSLSVCSFMNFVFSSNRK